MLIPKAQETRIRAVMRKLHEHKLAESLAPVEEAIRKWRAGEAPIFEIDDAIHQHQMRSRRYWHIYATTAVTSPEVPYILDEALQFKLITIEEHARFSSLWNRPRPGGKSKF